MSLNQKTQVVKKYHEVQSVEVKNRMLNMVVDGVPISKELKDISSVLAKATNAELAEFEISSSGYGIHWPLVDEDISFDALMGISYKMGVLKMPRQKRV